MGGNFGGRGPWLKSHLGPAGPVDACGVQIRLGIGCLPRSVGPIWPPGPLERRVRVSRIAGKWRPVPSQHEGGHDRDVWRLQIGRQGWTAGCSKGWSG
jgi:hypothetical protein